MRDAAARTYPTLRGPSFFRTPSFPVASILVTAVSLVVGMWRSDRPSFWYDEVATLHSSTRSLPDLLAMLVNIDAVHGVYYLGMHYWFRIVGVGEFSARFPSAVAVAVATAGVIVLARMFADERTALISGVVFLVLPRVTWAAVEARSSALTIAAAVWLTVLFLYALRKQQRTVWVLYGVALSASVVLFFYLITLLAVHFVVLVVRGESRRSGANWAVSAVIGALATIPFAQLVKVQSAQVSWIPPIDSNFPRVVFEYQWFLGAPVMAAAFGVLVAIGAVVGLRRAQPHWRRGAVPVALAWILLPMAALAFYSLVKSPIYLDRYLAFTAPAVALVGGLAIATLTRNVIGAVALVGVLVVLAVPSYLDQRGPWSKPLGMDFSDMNRFARDDVRQGDCVLFGSAAWNPASQRLAEYVDPESFAQARSIGQGRLATSGATLWGDEIPVAELGPQLQSCSVVWFFTDRERDDVEHVRLTSNDRWSLQPYHFVDSADFEFLRSQGFDIDGRTAFHESQVVRLTRDR